MGPRNATPSMGWLAARWLAGWGWGPGAPSDGPDRYCSRASRSWAWSHSGMRSSAGRFKHLHRRSACRAALRRRGAAAARCTRLPPPRPHSRPAPSTRQPSTYAAPRCTWIWRCRAEPPLERVAMARSRCEGMKVGAAAGMPSRLGARSTVVPLRVTTQHFSTCARGAGRGGAGWGGAGRGLEGGPLAPGGGAQKKARAWAGWPYPGQPAGLTPPAQPARGCTACRWRKFRPARSAGLQTSTWSSMQSSAHLVGAALDGRGPGAGADGVAGGGGVGRPTRHRPHHRADLGHRLRRVRDCRRGARAERQTVSSLFARAGGSISAPRASATPAAARKCRPEAPAHHALPRPPLRG